VILDMGAAISGLLLHAGARLGLAGTLAAARPRNHPGRGPAGLRKVIADYQAAARAAHRRPARRCAGAASRTVRPPDV